MAYKKQRGIAAQNMQNQYTGAWTTVNNHHLPWASVIKPNG